MRRVKRVLSVVVAAGMILGIPSSGLWATSAVPEPGAFGIPINPNASGTKLAGFMSIAYDIEMDTTGCPATGRRVNNMFVVLTLQQGNNIRPFNGSLDPAETFCFPGDTNQQVAFMFGIVSQQAIPHFFACQAGLTCPAFEVKSITNFLSSANGAMSMNITLAVH